MSLGKIIAIEGTDASGKNTQTGLLVNRLNSEGKPAVKLSFPCYQTPSGDILKRYLGKEPYDQQFGPANEVDPKVASTWYALDRFCNVNRINDSIFKGTNVILDRYVESNMAHQGGKIIDDEQRRCFIDWLEELEYGKFKLPRPDGVIFLYMPHEVGIELRKRRGEKADGHENNPHHLMNAQRVYLELSERFNWTRIDCAPSGEISSLKTVEDISQEVFCAAARIINSDLQPSEIN